MEIFKSKPTFVENRSKSKPTLDKNVANPNQLWAKIVANPNQQWLGYRQNIDKISTKKDIKNAA